MIEAQASNQRKGSQFLEVTWGNGYSAYVKPEEDGSFDKTKALKLAKGLVEKQKRSTEKKMKKLENLWLSLEKELEAQQDIKAKKQEDRADEEFFAG